MTKTLKDYRGVILFILTLVVMLNMYTSRINQLNSLDNTTNPKYSYYEK